MKRTFVSIDDANVAVDQIAAWYWDRGHSYSKIVVRLLDGKEFAHRDFNGSALATERLLEATCTLLRRPAA